MSRLNCFLLGIALSGFFVAGAMLPACANPRVGAQAPAAVFLTHGQPVSLAAFHGQKVMLWLFSTWCPSCQAGLPLLARDERAFSAHHLRLIILENYQNGGYPGPALHSLMDRYARVAQHASNWTIGRATRGTAAVYNSQSYPDIFYLIRPDGRIVTVSSAPSAHLKTILDFARS
ncbi:MAG: TlpA disulfide reductase family protein [Gammaproteobacteria bacterium]